MGAKASKREWAAPELGSIEVEKDGNKGVVRDRKHKLKPQILVWSLAFDQFTLGAPAGIMKAPDRFYYFSCIPLDLIFTVKFSVQLQ